jgi:peptidoglycan/xylan/chitin deacetylase (PgdA/CDA1 family)
MIAAPGGGGKPVQARTVRTPNSESPVHRSLLPALALLACAPLFSAWFQPAAAGAVPPALARAAARYAAEPIELQAPPALPAVAARVVSHGSRRDRLVALTFDACATHQASGYDEAIVRVLVETRTPATLFLGGKWMLEHPAATRRLAAEGLFELAGHGFLHRHLTRIGDDEVRSELLWTQAVMVALTGRQGSLVRAPYVEIDDRVARLSAELGLTLVQCDLPAGDPDPALGAERLRRHVIASARNGSIVVMHVNGRGWRTAEALPGIVAGLREKGFELVTVGEMLRRAPAAAAPSP